MSAGTDPAAAAATGGVQLGSTVPELRLLVDAEKMKLMAALLCDPNPIHFDVRALSALGLDERPVNQGPLNMGYVQTMLARWAGGRERLLSFRVRFLGNVLAGDTVLARGRVVELDETSRGQVATCEVTLDVVDGGAALAGQAEVLLGEQR